MPREYSFDKWLSTSWSSAAYSGTIESRWQRVRREMRRAKASVTHRTRISCDLIWAGRTKNLTGSYNDTLLCVYICTYTGTHTEKKQKNDRIIATFETDVRVARELCAVIFALYVITDNLTRRRTDTFPVRDTFTQTRETIVYVKRGETDRMSVVHLCRERSFAICDSAIALRRDVAHLSGLCQWREFPRAFLNPRESLASDDYYCFALPLII